MLRTVLKKSGRRNAGPDASYQDKFSKCCGSVQREGDGSASPIIALFLASIPAMLGELRHGFFLPEAEQEIRTGQAAAGETRDSSLPVRVRFGLSTRNPNAVSPAAGGEDVVSSIGSSIDETRVVPLAAASSLGVLTLLLSSP